MNFNLEERKAIAKTMVPALKGKNWFEAFKKVYHEAHPAELQGNVDDETPDVDASLEILNNILMGMEAYSDLSFATLYTTNSATFKIPVGEYSAAVGPISSGVMPQSPKVVTFIDVALDTLEGASVTWSSSYLEDASFPVMSEMMQGVGHDIQVYMCEKLVDALEAISEGNLAGGAYVEITEDAVTWAQFKNLLKAIDLEGYGPADVVLANPSVYWDLLALNEFFSTIVIGTPETLRTGVIQLTLGVRVIKCDAVSVEMGLIALNSKKAIGLVTRREVTTEPINKPEEDTYGFVVKFRKKEAVRLEKAVAIGEVTPASP